MSTRPFGSGIPLVIDTSTWNRQTHPRVLAGWEATVIAELFVACPVAVLEILVAARDEHEFADAAAAFAAIPQAPVTPSVSRAAFAAAAELKGSRRLPVTDYLIVRLPE